VARHARSASRGPPSPVDVRAGTRNGLDDRPRASGNTDSNTPPNAPAPPQDRGILTAFQPQARARWPRLPAPTVEGLTGGDFLPSEPEPRAWPPGRVPQRISEGRKQPPVSDTPAAGRLARGPRTSRGPLVPIVEAKRQLVSPGLRRGRLLRSPDAVPGTNRGAAGGVTRRARVSTPSRLRRRSGFPTGPGRRPSAPQRSRSGRGRGGCGACVASAVTPTQCARAGLRAKVWTLVMSPPHPSTRQGRQRS
jgi:hypothetical protein